jgi:hypothetical protein
MKAVISLFLFCIACCLFACKVHYDMTGVNLGSAKTVSVEYFKNNATLAKPTYSASLTESLKDILTSQSSLTLQPRGGDLQFEGSVTGYAVSPVAIQSGNDQAAFNRLTITLSVKFTNSKDETKNFEMPFSRYADYPSSKNLNAVEDELIRTINDQLVQDIFNKALVNW